MSKTKKYLERTDTNKTHNKKNLNKTNPDKKVSKIEILKDPQTKIKPVKIKKNVLHKFDKGDTVKSTGLKTKYHQKLWQERDKQIELAIRQSARTTVLLNEQEGFIDAETDVKTICQSEIVSNVDITSASKHFNLNVDQFGPYKHKYSVNGRHLLLGGKRGHVAAIDWITKNLSCEMNVMEEIFDISWLYNESMFAVAQKSFVHIYDNKVHVFTLNSTRNFFLYFQIYRDYNCIV